MTTKAKRIATPKPVKPPRPLRCSCKTRGPAKCQMHAMAYYARQAAIAPRLELKTAAARLYTVMFKYSNAGAWMWMGISDAERTALADALLDVDMKL